MPFQCSRCGRPSLEITAKIELAPDSRWDEIAVQIIRCGVCAFKGAAIYQESRRGSFDNDNFDHTGYSLAVQELLKAEKLIQQCPKPQDSRCRCFSHRELGKLNLSGGWIGMEHLSLSDPFPIRLIVQNPPDPMFPI